MFGVITILNTKVTDENKILSVEEYRTKIRPHLKGIINNLQESDTNFISSGDDNDEDGVMHSKSDNIETMISNEAIKVIKKFSDSLKNRYQNNLESM